jgi:uncharacterized delta-60 repeat protein
LRQPELPRLELFNMPQISASSFQKRFENGLTPRKRGEKMPTSRQVSHIRPLCIIAFIVLIGLSSATFSQSVSKTSQKPTPRPSPTPAPGCSVGSGNTNSWVGSGGLDFSFGSGGIVMTDVGGPTSSADGVRELLVQPDGKVVTIGAVRNSIGAIDNIITRYTVTGVLDTGDGTAENPGFGNPDPANPSLRLGYTTVSLPGDVETPQGGVLDPNGNILIIAYYNIKMARLTPTGQLDTSFGNGGMIEHIIPGDRFDASNATFDSSGRILVSGAEFGFKVARFTPNGFLDTTFGNGGSVTYNISGSKRGRSGVGSVATQWVNGTERIVLGGGSASGPSAPGTYALMRFTDAGAVDTTFGNSGVVLTNFYNTGDGIRDIAIDSQNRIVAVGDTRNCGGLQDASFARYLPNGALDTSFSGDGKFSQDIYGTNNIAWSVAIQSDDKIVASGYAATAANGNDSTVTRLNVDGTPDASFGPGALGPGIAATDLDNTSNMGRSLAISPNGTIVVGGNGGIGYGSMVARYLP